MMKDTQLDMEGMGQITVRGIRNGLKSQVTREEL